MDAAVVTRPTPREHGMAMPAECAAHELTLMAWPTRLELWGDALGRAKGEYAAVARAIAAFEPVLMVAAPGVAAEVRDACGEAIGVLELVMPRRGATVAQDDRVDTRLALLDAE
jgi:agmatine/peptidylarginine deiminase